MFHVAPDRRFDIGHSCMQVLPGGLVIWRSAAEVPPYAKLIANAGFKVKCLQQAKDGYMDRVNMYSSFWVAERV